MVQLAEEGVGVAVEDGAVRVSRGGHRTDVLACRWHCNRSGQELQSGQQGLLHQGAAAFHRQHLGALLPELVKVLGELTDGQSFSTGLQVTEGFVAEGSGRHHAGNPHRVQGFGNPKRDFQDGPFFNL